MHISAIAVASTFGLSGSESGTKIRKVIDGFEDYILNNTEKP